MSKEKSLKYYRGIVDTLREERDALKAKLTNYPVLEARDASHRVHAAEQARTIESLKRDAEKAKAGEAEARASLKSANDTLAAKSAELKEAETAESGLRVHLAERDQMISNLRNDLENLRSKDLDTKSLRERLRKKTDEVFALEKELRNFRGSRAALNDVRSHSDAEAPNKLTAPQEK